MIDSRLMPAFGKLRIGEITPLAVQSWVNTLTVGKGSRKFYLAVLRSMWETAEQWNVVTTRNPAKGIRVGTGGFVHDRKAFDPSQVRKLIDSLDPQYRLPAEIAVCCNRASVRLSP